MSATTADGAGVDAPAGGDMADPGAGGGDGRPPGFGAAVAAEWSKLVALRSARVSVLLGIVLSVAVTGLLAWAVVATWQEWPADERAEFNPTENALIGILVTSMFFAVLGVTTVTSEYSSRMIALTFVATPRRERVVLAKMLVVAVATMLGTLVAVVGMIVVARLVFAGYDLPGPDTGRTVRLVLGVSAGAGLFPMIGVTVAFVVRSAAGSVTALLAMIFGPPVLGPLLPRWWQQHGERYLPSQATDSLTLPFDSPGQLGTGVAALTVAAWMIGFTALAIAVVRKRDA